MKKKWIRIVSLVVLGLMMFGLVACSEAEEQAQEHFKIESLYIADQTEVNKTDVLVYRFKVVDDMKATAFKYSIDHNEEIAVSGKVSENDETESDVKLYNFDSGVKIINVNGLEPARTSLRFICIKIL